MRRVYDSSMAWHGGVWCDVMEMAASRLCCGIKACKAQAWCEILVVLARGRQLQAQVEENVKAAATWQARYVELQVRCACVRVGGGSAPCSCAACRCVRAGLVASGCTDEDAMSWHAVGWWCLSWLA